MNLIINIDFFSIAPNASWVINMRYVLRKEVRASFNICEKGGMMKVKGRCTNSI